MKMIHYYRYVSYILTSSFYMFYGEYPLSSKLGVILCLGVAAIILDYIYTKDYDNLKLIKLMIIIETIGNISILLPSGGINSPYIWYSLNAVLVSAYLLSAFFMFVNLLTYTVILAFISFYLMPNSNMSFENSMLQNSNLILSYILIIIALNLLVMLARDINNKRLDIEKINGELIEANNMLAESLGNISSLYQNVYAFVTVKNKDRLGAIIAEYTQKTTKATFAFIYTRTNSGKFALETYGEIDNETKNALLSAIKTHINYILTSDVTKDTVIRDKIADKEVVITAIDFSGSFGGLMGIEMNRDNGKIIENQNIDQIRMLASLGAILFERFKIEETYQNLLISEEQHRIANEIHDGVSQRLFYTSCKISTLTNMAINHKQIDLIAELHTLQDSMTAAIKELRETIYSNGSENIVENVFEESIRKYINEIKKLSNVSVDFKINGNFDYVDYELKKVILRIIAESCGNAIRHGKSENISIELSGYDEIIKIVICDDGIGFDLSKKIRESSIGFGIRNMNSLVYSLNGSIDIASKLSQGTTISVLLPLVCHSEGEDME